MPLSSDSCLAENIYVELPESFESCEAPTLPALPRRSLSYQTARKRSYSETITGSGGIDEKQINGQFRTNWRDLFSGKWPYLTPLFYKSEEDTLSKLQEQTKNLENTFHLSSTSLTSSQWDGSIRDIWSGSHRNANEVCEMESSDRMSDDKPKRCEKTCRRFLCVFLGFSVLGAILAGIGLSLILTSYSRDRQLLYKEDTFVNVGLSDGEENYLTKTFCDVVRVFLRGVDFPTDRGLASCRAYMRLVQGSEDINIVLQISPHKGFTVKEKIKRALSEEIIAEGAYRVKGSDRCIYVGGPSSHINCEKNHSLGRTAMSETTSPAFTIPMEVRNTEAAEPVPGLGPIQPSSINVVAEEQQSSTVRLEPSSSEAFSTSFNIAPDTSLSASVELVSTPLVPADLRSEVYDQISDETISVSPTYSQPISSITSGESTPSAWLYQASSTLTPLEVGATSSTTIPLSSPSDSTEIVTNYPGFEAQTKNNTIATTGLELKTTSDTLDQTTPNNHIESNQIDTNSDFSKAQLEDLGLKTTSDRLSQTTPNSLLEANSDTNSDYSKTQIETVIDTSKSNKSELFQDIYAELKGLNEADLMFRFNLYGPSGSKNYLRFPIVTGSNGKFLFSPLSNKDPIDIETKKGKHRSSTTDPILIANDSITAIEMNSTELKTMVGAVEEIQNDKRNVIKERPKPMVVDWKTPPVAKPTNFPNGWKGKNTGFNRKPVNGSPSGPKVIFSVPNLEHSNSV